jgi:ABC-type multidrug transport system fused ATPase/permease subunit
MNPEDAAADPSAQAVPTDADVPPADTADAVASDAVHETPVESQPEEEAPRVFDAQAHAVTSSAVEKVLADLHDKEVEEINQMKATLIDSAELATRASGLAALAGGAMQKATAKLTETYGAAQHLGMIVLAVFVALSVVSLTLFGFMTYRLQERVSQLDAMLVAVGKRVVAMDESIDLFNNTGAVLGDVSLKQSGLVTSQKQLESRVDDVAKGLGNMIDAMAKKPAAETKTQDNTKQLQQALEQTTKQVQALEQKIQAQGEVLKQLAAQGQRPVVVQTDTAALKKAAEAAAKSMKDKMDQEAAARAAAVPAAPPPPPAKPKERPVQYPRPGSTE